uniref:GOST seven transmembrane domain-containing protein n=1 Tax=Strigamia maritima TaxID=126957 RepID=T1IML1_STRMM
MTFTSREMKELLLLVFTFICPICLSLPEQGVWHFDVNQFNGFVAVSKVVYKNSALHIKVNCDEPRTKATKIDISYIVWMLPCYERGLQFDKSQDLEDMKVFHEHPDSFHVNNIQEESSYFTNESPKVTYDCVVHNTIVIPTIDSKNFVKHRLIPVGTPTDQVDKVEKISTLKSKLIDQTVSPTTEVSVATETTKKGQRKREITSIDSAEITVSTPTTTLKPTKEKKVDTTNKTEEILIDAVKKSGDQPQLLFTSEGVYIVSLLITSLNFETPFSASVDIEIKGTDGYLSATEWPLLPFYGTMCVVYVFYGIGWLIISACQWRDLLRIQFWIGGVIFLGMLEKAVFFGEFQSLHNTGKSVRGAVIAAEIVSCLKRTLARMLIIIVSLGFGIVKPRLGPLLHRVVGVGALYFILSLVEGLMRVLGIRNDPYHQFCTDDANIAAQKKYYQIKSLQAFYEYFNICCCRFAFTPLLDAPDDDEEDEEIPLPDAFDGMKMRGTKNQNNVTKGVEDDLKWIDENIPSGISDVALPSLLDSDEEIMTTKFEMSKMN